MKALVLFISILAFGLSNMAQAQQVLSLPFKFDVAAGQQAIHGLTGSFDFQTLSPGESGRAFSAPSLILEDTVVMSNSYHLTLHSGSFVSDRGSFGAEALRCSGPAVVVSAREPRGPAPTVLEFSGVSLDQVVRILQADQALLPDCGKGTWSVDLIPESFLLSVPLSAQPGRYTSTITLTLNVGI